MRILKFIVLCAVLVAFSAQAQATLITPDTEPQWTGTETSQAAIDLAIASFIGDADELYKMNVGGSEEGPLSGSYETTFFNTPSDPSGADIVYTGGDIVGQPAYLLVKDGKQDPAWYLFQLFDFEIPTQDDWNGIDTLELRDFWTDQGAISHVTLYGGQHQVPEPFTLLLLGVGIVGIAGCRRFIRN
jgi:hypothetical protein